MPEDWPFADPENLAVFTLKRIVRGESPVRLVSHDEDDGGWQFLDGAGADVEDAAIVSLLCMVELDPSLVELADLPVGWSAVRSGPFDPWERINPETARDRKVITDVEEFGWHVAMIPEDDGGAGFAFSIGLYKNFNHPEIVIIGLGIETMHGMINVIGEEVREGRPFAPSGFSGIMSGAAVVFFAYIGFDAVSTTAEETRNPQRDMPIGMIASLVICTVLYVLMSGVLTGMHPYKMYLDDSAAVATAFQGNRLVQALISAGALAGMTSVLLVFQLGQPRIFMAMARDGLLPAYFSRIHPRFRTPWITTIWTGVIVGTVAMFVDIGTLADLTNIGTLFAFILVCIGVCVLRKTAPERRRPFRVPLVPWVPILGMIMCGGLMLSLTVLTWIRFFVWLAIGLAIYFMYGVRHSRLRKQAGAEPPPAVG